MDKEYFIIQNNIKTGPLTFEQLININIKPDTLVWTDGMPDWKQCKELEEFNIIFKNIPPPTPTENTINKFAHYRKKISVITFILFLISALITFIVLKLERNNLKAELKSKIESVFNGKASIQDGVVYGCKGELKVVDYKNSSNWVSTDEWWKIENLYSYYDLVEGGGFQLFRATKFDDDKFQIEILKSDKIGFTSSKNYVFPCQYYINSCFKYLTEYEKTSSYEIGKLIEIKSLPTLQNKYFHIVNTEPEEETPMGHKYKSWASLNPPPYIKSELGEKVYYSLTGKYYKVTDNEYVWMKDLMFYVFIELVAFIFLIIITIGLLRFVS